ncbi:MAG: hypothetical protein IT331_25745 [Anaerolineae bacterium]|nr:hypothetical protein [Anaerolineae bacterium]
MDETLIYLNGIDGSTGEYLSEPLTVVELEELARHEVLDPSMQSEMQAKVIEKKKNLGTKYNVDPTDLAQAGWGVILARDADPQIREALSELLNWRRKQANKNKNLYREYVGAQGLNKGESKNEFLARHGAAPGPVDPSQVPYYLLLVGDPKAIPYSFQYQLDVAYAVGRIHFDTAEEYARYAHSVVEVEKGKLKLPRRAAFYAVRNPDDYSTDLSTRLLTKPLVERLQPDNAAWAFTTHTGAEATKARMLSALGGDATPAFLFTASHGMALPNDDPRQREHQGALISQDYPGPREWRKALPQDFYLAGDDLPSSARLGGLISFHFACYGAGTPDRNEFPTEKIKPSMIPTRSFLARLPQRMLAHPGGGALAAIGHIERAWSYSFSWDALKEQTAVFESAIGRMLQGSPVGAAMEYFGERAAELATDLGMAREETQAKTRSDNPQQLGFLWTANNDARSYVILGDPAVRLAFSDEANAEPERTAINMQAITLAPAQGGASEPVQSGQIAPGVAAGIADDVSAAVTNLRLALEQFANKVSAILSETVDDVTRLQVTTYVSDEMEGVVWDRTKKTFGGDVKKRAVTTMQLDGDTQVVVPRRTSDVDEELWTIHSATVTQAQAYRAEMMKAAVAAAAGLFNALKPGG